MAPPRSGEGLEVSPGCVVPLSELSWRFATSGGPGGQHANRSATQAEVSFDVWSSDALSDRQKRQIAERVGPLVTATASDTRSQARNRDLALNRLRDRLADALEEPMTRQATRPSRAGKERRLSRKRRRSQKKRLRRPVSPDED